MILSKILHEKRSFIEESKRKIPQKEILDKIAAPPQTRGFKHAISKPHVINLIAEIKRSSPSKGRIVEDFDPVRIAQVYFANGASALSILTEEKYFEGKLSYIEDVKKTVSLPVLRKDFIIDEYQVYESSLAGADAVLLIADILAQEELSKFVGLCRQLNMTELVEVHSEEDIEKALKADAQVIGINNRDLHTFEVDLETTERILQFIPKDKIIVSESGINSYDDVAYLRSLGVHSILVGESLLRSPDIGAKVRELIGHK